MSLIKNTGYNLCQAAKLVNTQIQYKHASRDKIHLKKTALIRCDGDYSQDLFFEANYELEVEKRTNIKP